MSLFFCVYPVHISLGQYCQKMLLEIGRLKKDKMEGFSHIAVGLTIEGGSFLLHIMWE